MFRMWGKIFKNNHLLRDTVSVRSEDDTRTHKVLAALSDICNELDLEHPHWLDKNIAEFQKVSKTRFTQDNFIETIPFDYLEIHIIEED